MFHQQSFFCPTAASGMIRAQKQAMVFFKQAHNQGETDKKKPFLKKRGKCSGSSQTLPCGANDFYSILFFRHRREYDNLHDISSSAKQIKVRNCNGIKLMNMILVVACSRNGSLSTKYGMREDGKIGMPRKIQCTSQGND